MNAWSTWLPISEETKLKISKTLTGRKRGYFRPTSKETKQKLREAALGKHHSVEHKARISAGLMGKSKKFKTEESKKKMIAQGKRLSLRENFRIPFKFTHPEKQMQEILSNLNIPFIPQHHVRDIQHYYIADFFLPIDNAIIEVDGRYWHNFPNGKEVDHIRNDEMTEKGYKVCRFWEGRFSKHDVLEKLDRYVLEVNDV